DQAAARQAAARVRAQRKADQAAARKAAQLRELEAKRDLLDVLRARPVAPDPPAAVPASTPAQRHEREIAKQKAERERFREQAIARGPDPEQAKRVDELRKQFEAMGIQTIAMERSPSALMATADLDALGALDRRIARLERLQLLDAQNAVAGGPGLPMPTHKAAVDALKARGVDVGRLPMKGMPAGWVQVVEAELRQLDDLDWAPDIALLETTRKKQRNAQAWMRAGGDLVGDI